MPRAWALGREGGRREALGSGAGSGTTEELQEDNCRKSPVRSFRGSPAPPRALEGRALGVGVGRGPRSGRFQQLENFHWDGGDFLPEEGP